MISMGMDPETISRATALSKKEIEEFLNDLELASKV